MGMFDRLRAIFGRKAETETLPGGVSMPAPEDRSRREEDQRRDVVAAYADAEKRIGQWVIQSRERVVYAYAALCSVFENGEADRAVEILETLGETAGIVAATPVYLGEGDAVDFSRWCETAFDSPDDTAKIAAKLRAATDSFERQSRGADAVQSSSGEDSAQKASQDLLRAWQSCQARRNQATSHIQQVSMLHRGLLKAVETGNADLTAQLCEALEESENKNAVFSIRPYEDRPESFADLAAQNAADAEKSQRAVALLIKAGSPAGAALFKGFIEKENMQALSEALSSLILTKGEDERQALLLSLVSADEGKPLPLLAVAAQKALKEEGTDTGKEILEMLMSTEGNDLAAAALFYKAAAGCPEDLAKQLKAMGDVIAGGFIQTGPGDFVNLSQAGYISLSSGARVAGNGWEVPMGKGSSREIAEYLRRKEGYVFAGRDRFINLKEATALVADPASRESPSLILSAGKIVRRIAVEGTEQGDALAQAGALPHWRRLGNGIALSTKGQGHFWLGEEIEGRQTLYIVLPGRSDTLEICLPAKTAQAHFNEMIKTSSVVLLGENQAVNAGDVNSLWQKKEAPDVEPGKKRIVFMIGTNECECDLPEDDIEALLKALAKDYGYFRIATPGGVEFLNPAGMANIWLSEDGLEYLSNGEGVIIDGINKRDGRRIINEIASIYPRFMSLHTDDHLNLSHADYIRAEDEGIAFMIAGEERISTPEDTGGGSEFKKIDYCVRQEGFLRVDERTCINMDKLAYMLIDDGMEQGRKNMVFGFGGNRQSVLPVELPEDQAGRLYDAVIQWGRRGVVAAQAGVLPEHITSWLEKGFAREDEKPAAAPVNGAQARIQPQAPVL